MGFILNAQEPTDEVAVPLEGCAWLGRVCLCPGCVLYVSGIVEYVIFCDWLPSLSVVFKACLCCSLYQKCILSVASTPLCRQTACCLCIPQLIGIWVISPLVIVNNAG